MTSVYKNVNVASLKTSINTAKTELSTHKFIIKAIKSELSRKATLEALVSKEINRTLSLVLENTEINGSIPKIEKMLNNMSMAISYVESIQEAERKITELKKVLYKMVAYTYTVNIGNGRTTTRTRYKKEKDQSVQNQINQLESAIKDYERQITNYLK